MSKRFLQLHVLTSYPAALLNRDDAGFAKRLPFGNGVRTRISSQCLKRHWRTHDGAFSLTEIGVDMAVRSRLTFQRKIYEPLVAEGINPDLADAVTRALMENVLGKSAKAKSKAKADDKTGSEILTSQITVLGVPELLWMLDEARAVCAEQTDVKKAGEALKSRLGKEGEKNLKALKNAAIGLDGAMFGRMVTSDILARGDAAVHVAHAFTVHGEQTESDYFSAVDDLLQIEDGKLGSGHINSTELTSGLYYVYVAVDLPLLVSNLEGCHRKDWESANKELAARVVEHLVQIVATVSPGAKLGATAPHAYASAVLAELGNSQPRTLANAFLNTVNTTRNNPDLLENTYLAMAGHIRDLDAMYGVTTARQLAATGASKELVGAIGVSKPVPLTELAEWIGKEIRLAERAVAPA